jgi:ATP-dependent RNA helicase DDX56/DBP9
VHPISAQPTISSRADAHAECIPKILEGKDVVSRARTGSGKTLAYLLPALHRIISSWGQAAPGWQVLVLVPTRELCEQVRSEALAITQHCGMDIGVSCSAAVHQPMLHVSFMLILTSARTTAG